MQAVILPIGIIMAACVNGRETGISFTIEQAEIQDLTEECVQKKYS